MNQGPGDGDQGPRSGRRRRKLALGLLLLLLSVIGAAHVAELRPGHPWGDDFAMYILHARNLVERLPYAKTGYIFDPHSPETGPAAYPPLCPLLLAPVYARFGLDFVALKGVSVGCFLVFLLGVGLGFRRTLPRPALLALVVLLGLNHFFLRDTNTVNSDEPLLAFLYLCLFLIGQLRDADATRRRTVLAIGVGLSAYLAYAARTVGVLLIPAILLEDLLNTRRIRRATLLAIAVFALLAVVQGLCFPDQRDYLATMTVGPATLARHAAWYAQRLAAFWSNGYCQPAAAGLAASVMLLAMLGYWRRLRGKPTVYEIFAPLYFATILLWPAYGGERLLYPILPLWLFYASAGLQDPLLTARSRLRRAVIAGLLPAVAATYVACWTRADDVRAAEGIGQPNAAALFRYIAGQTQSSDVIVFVKPRALALLAGRRASTYHQVTEDRQLWDYFRSIDARYVVAVERDRAIGPTVPAALLEFLRGFLARHRSRFDEVYRNDDFAVYRIRD